MANNRLYIGNRRTKKYLCIAKSGDDWGELFPSDVWIINEMLESDCPWDGKTNLMFFTDSDNEACDYFMGISTGGYVETL